MTAKRVKIKSGLFRDSLTPKASTSNPSGSKFSSKFFKSFLKNNLARMPTPSTPRPFIRVPIPGNIIF